MDFRQRGRAGGSTTTNYFYDESGQLAAESVNGVWSRDYIRDGAGNLIATENAAGGTCTTCYFAYDHLGSVRLVMDQSGNVVGRHDYLPFGEDVSGNAGRTTPGFHMPGSVAVDAAQQFTGQVRDQEAGQDYFNARYFTPPQGRFNSVDPGNAGADFTSSQSWNGYGYVLGNPLNAVDPSGTRWVTFQVQVCTPSISSTIVYYTLPSGSSSTGTTSACHSVPMEIWVDDDPPVISISGGSGTGGAGPGGGSGGGGSGGASAQATQKKGSCPNVPVLPPGESVNANMRATTQTPLPNVSLPGFALMNAGSAAGRLASWAANVCCWSSAWGYQAKGTVYDDGGNFNYGATGTALGLPSGVIMWAGGAVKNLNYWSKGRLNPYRDLPYTNDPHKMQMIWQGIQYAKNGC